LEEGSIFRKGKLQIAVFIFLTALILQGCASRVTLGPVYLYPKVGPVDIELKSFSFYPNHIAILKNETPFTFRLKNTSQIKHNFTLMNDHKNILMNIDIIQNESTTVTIESLDSGNYTFYCNQFLHRFLGMEGMFMVD